MAVSTAAAILGGSAISGVLGAASSRSAGRAQEAATNASIGEQRRQYDQTRADFGPQRQLGYGAVNEIARLFGYPMQQQTTGPAQRFSTPFGQFNVPGQPTTSLTSPSGPDMSAFWTSPDYNFRRTEGTRGLERSAAARGGAFSGNALRALSEFNSGLASTEFDNYLNRRFNIAGLGQVANQSTANAGMNAANNISSGLIAGGNARASGILGQANSINNAFNTGLNNYLLYRGGYFNAS